MPTLIDGPSTSQGSVHHHHHHHPTHSFDLPDLPSVPPYPCPFLTDEEIKTYLEPLYLRSWTVQPSDPEHSKTPAPELVKSFKFSSESAAREFLEDFVQWVETRENVRTLSPEHVASTNTPRAHSTMRPRRWNRLWLPSGCTRTLGSGLHRTLKNRAKLGSPLGSPFATFASHTCWRLRCITRERRPRTPKPHLKGSRAPPRRWRRADDRLSRDDYWHRQMIILES